MFLSQGFKVFTFALSILVLFYMMTMIRRAKQCGAHGQSAGKAAETAERSKRSHSPHKNARARGDSRRTGSTISSESPSLATESNEYTSSSNDPTDRSPNSALDQDYPDGPTSPIAMVDASQNGYMPNIRAASTRTCIVQLVKLQYEYSRLCNKNRASSAFPFREGEKSIMKKNPNYRFETPMQSTEIGGSTQEYAYEVDLEPEPEPEPEPKRESRCAYFWQRVHDLLCYRLCGLKRGEEVLRGEEIVVDLTSAEAESPSFYLRLGALGASIVYNCTSSTLCASRVFLIV